MPLKQTVATQFALNAFNSASPSGMSDPITGLPYAGELDLGDYFDLTQPEALQLSDTTIGTLFQGRYRLVQVDSGATAAKIARGRIAGIVLGYRVQSVVILTAGSGQTPGNYTATASTGTATIAYTIAAGGTLTAVSLTNAGGPYSAAPTFTIAAGGTPGTVSVQMSDNVNYVTDYDSGIASIARGVFLTALTPGNYGFIQEAGIATVVGDASIGSGAAAGKIVNAAATGTVTAASANVFNGTSLGIAYDTPANSILFKAGLYLPNYAG